MTRTGSLALAALAALTLIVWLGPLRRGTSAALSGAVPAAARGADHTAALAPLAPSDPSAPSSAGPGESPQRRAAEGAVAPEAAPPAHASLVVRAVRASDAAPFVGEVVRLRRAGARGIDRATSQDVDGVTDTTGAASFDGLEPGRYLVLSLRSAGRGVELAAGARETITLTLASGVAVSGQVVDTNGAPIPGAAILVSERWNPTRVARAADADAAGRFELADVTPESYVSARAPGRAASRQVVPRGAPGDHMEVVLTLESSGALVRGVVLESGDRPVVGAVVLIGEEPGAWQPRGGYDTLAAAPVRLVTDEDGRFATDEATPGLGLLRVRAPGLGPHVAPLDVPREGVRDLVVRLVPAARVAGVVRGGDGATAAGAMVGEAREGMLGEPALVRAGVDGSFELGDLAAGTRVFEAQHATLGRVRAELTLAPGEVLDWNPVLAPTLAIHGRLTYRDGRPGARLLVAAAAPDARGTTSTTSDDDGRFRLPHLDPLPHTVTVQPPRTGDGLAGGWLASFPLRSVEGVIPSDEALDLVLDEPLNDGRVLATVLGPDGTPVQGARLLVWHDAKRLWRTLDAAAATGRVEAERVPAGTLSLSIEAPGYGTHVLGERALEASGTLDLGEVRLAATGTVGGAVHGVDAARLATVEVWLLPLSGDARWAAGRIVDGRLESEPLPAGRWRLTARGRGVLYRELELEVRAGARTDVDLALTPCGEQRVRVTTATALPHAPFGELVDAAGARVWQDGVLRRDGEAFVADVAAPPGIYTFTTGTSSEHRASRSLTFTGADDDGEVELTLP